MTRWHEGALRIGADSPTGPPPLDPSATSAREQLAHELAGQQYAAARPTIFDVIIQWLEKTFNSIFNQTAGAGIGGSALIIIVIVVVIVAAAIVGFFVFGLPRINRRSAVTGALFGDEDDRDAASIRRAAERAASSGDFATAIEEGFRAIARGLAERTILTTFPGTTAHAFALRAAEPFPLLEAELGAAADSFDAVRYLGQAGTEAGWAQVRALDSDLRAARPIFEGASA